MKWMEPPDFRCLSVPSWSLSHTQVWPYAHYGSYSELWECLLGREAKNSLRFWSQPDDLDFCNITFKVVRNPVDIFCMGSVFQYRICISTQVLLKCM